MPIYFGIFNAHAPTKRPPHPIVKSKMHVGLKRQYTSIAIRGLKIEIGV